MKPGFQKIKLPNSIWIVPNYYSNLKYLGSGAFGQVW